MRYVVGYTADRGGKQALNLAGSLAKSSLEDEDPIQLDLVIVARQQSPVVAGNIGADPAGFEEILDATTHEWAQSALAQVPEGVTAQVHIRAATSPAQGLIDAAEELGAGVIVVAPQAKRLSRSLGSEANTLLHSSPVPVLLATPRSSTQTAEIPAMTRVTAFVGTREGAEVVAATASIVAQNHNLSLRIVSLISMDGLTYHPGDQVARTRDLIEDIAGRTSLASTVVISHGRDMEEAISSLDWEPGEVALIGSSRLGGERLFLGSTAYKVVREVPVPVAVIPRKQQGKTTLHTNDDHPDAAAVQDGQHPPKQDEA